MSDFLDQPVAGPISLNSSQASPRRATDIDRLIGARLRRLRKQLKVRQSTVAERIGVSFPQIQKYESGANRVSVSALIRICNVLGLQPYAVLAAICDDIEREEARN